MLFLILMKMERLNALKGTGKENALITSMNLMKNSCLSTKK